MPTIQYRPPVKSPKMIIQKVDKYQGNFLLMVGIVAVAAADALELAELLI